MGLLLLLTSALLSSYVGPRSVDAQNSFVIRAITLYLEPHENVVRDTNVTVRCRPMVSISGHQPVIREYTVFKDGVTVYTKKISSADDLVYLLPNARVSNTGKYKCQISIEGRKRSSEAKKLTVTGLSTPVLQLHQDRLGEGEELTASCTAPGETGSIIFYFYEDMKEKHELRVSTNHVEVNLTFSGLGHHTIQCAYIVQLSPGSIQSEKSSAHHVTVRELPISPDLEIVPQSKVYEGDQLNVYCAVKGSQNPDTVTVYLSRGSQLLESGLSKVNHTMEAPATEPSEFECRVQMGNVGKAVTKVVSVTELFSVPTLTMSPVEVFQKESMTLICKSEEFASERLQKEELTYAIDPPQTFLVSRNNGEFVGKALSYDFNYTCVARAKGIEKRSQTLTIRPKVSVSTPRISVVGRAVLGKPFKVLCQSDHGSLPINYTLMDNYHPLSSVTVKTPNEQALFDVTVHKPSDINKFVCEATNSGRDGVFSRSLATIVIEPLSQPVLTVIPPVAEITEGVNILFICSIRGTPPVTFKIYRVGHDQPLFTTTSSENNTSYEIQDLVKDHSGVYYFEAINHANGIVISEAVTIEVRLALWKKAVIGGFCLLAISVLVAVCVLYFKSKRGDRQAGAELSVKPSSPKSDESLTGTLTHDTEVYNAATDAAPAPGYDGIEGRVTNGTRDSVASLPAGLSNRSSYSLPATV